MRWRMHLPSFVYPGRELFYRQWTSSGNLVVLIHFWWKTHLRIYLFLHKFNRTSILVWTIIYFEPWYSKISKYFLRYGKNIWQATSPGHIQEVFGPANWQRMRTTSVYVEGISERVTWFIKWLYCVLSVCPKSSRSTQCLLPPVSRRRGTTSLRHRERTWSSGVNIVR